MSLSQIFQRIFIPHLWYQISKMKPLNKYHEKHPVFHEFGENFQFPSQKFLNTNCLQSSILKIWHSGSQANQKKLTSKILFLLCFEK